MQLASTSVGDAVQRPDRKADIREVLMRQLLGFEFRLDGFEHFDRCAFRGPYEHHKLAVAIKKSPLGRSLRKGAFARSTEHRQGEQSALQYGGLDFVDDLQMVGDQPRLKVSG